MTRPVEDADFARVALRVATAIVVENGEVMLPGETYVCWHSDPSPNWPVSARVMIAVESTCSDHGALATLTIEQAREIAAALESAAAGAESAMRGGRRG